MINLQDVEQKAAEAGDIFKDQSGIQWVLFYVGGEPPAHQANNHLLQQIGKKGKMLSGTRNMQGVSVKSLQSRFLRVGHYPAYKEDFKLFKTKALKDHWLS